MTKRRFKKSLLESTNHPKVQEALAKWKVTSQNVSTNITAFSQGGQGVLFRVAMDSHLDSILKIPNYAARDVDDYKRAENGIRKEGVVLKNVEPNNSLPKFYDYESEGKWLWREFVEGDCLSLFLKRYDFGPKQRIVLFQSFTELVRDLFRSFHESSLGCYVLRDLKPRNIVCNSKFVMKIVDLGGVRSENHMISVKSKTKRLGKGKWKFWAPEQLLEEKTWLSRKVDYFSFGVSSLYILTGKKVFSNAEDQFFNAMKNYRKEYFAACQRLEDLYAKSYLSKEEVTFLKACIEPNYKKRPGTFII